MEKYGKYEAGIGSWLAKGLGRAGRYIRFGGTGTAAKLTRNQLGAARAASKAKSVAAAEHAAISKNLSSLEKGMGDVKGLASKTVYVGGKPTTYGAAKEAQIAAAKRMESAGKELTGLEGGLKHQKLTSPERAGSYVRSGGHSGITKGKRAAGKYAKDVQKTHAVRGTAAGTAPVPKPTPAPAAAAPNAPMSQAKVTNPKPVEPGTEALTPGEALKHKDALKTKLNTKTGEGAGAGTGAGEGGEGTTKLMDQLKGLYNKNPLATAGVGGLAGLTAYNSLFKQPTVYT